MRMGTLGTHWLPTCATLRSAFIGQLTALNHATRMALHRAGYSTTLEPQLLDPKPKTSTTRETGNACPRVHRRKVQHLFVYVSEWLPHCFVDAVVNCPSALSFAPRGQPRRGTAAAGKFQERTQSTKARTSDLYFTYPARVGSFAARLCPLKMEVWRTFGYFSAEVEVAAW